MAIPTILDTDPAKLDDLLNVIGDAANTDIAALDTRIDSIEAGAARGTGSHYVVTDLSALNALSTAVIGDTAYMTTPGTGIEAVWWEAYAGSGSTIDWRVTNMVRASSKANLDSFISAVAAIADTRFVIGNFACDTSNNLIYRFTSAVGAIAAWEAPVTSYTPTFTNLTTTGGTTLDVKYWVSQGRVCIEGLVTLGGASVTGDVTFTLPTALPAHAKYATANTAWRVGVTMLRAAGTPVPGGVEIPNTTTTARLLADNVAGTYPARTALTASVPATWAAGNTITFLFDYEAA